MSNLISLDQVQTKERLPFDELVEALRQQFRSDVEVPLRHQHPINVEGEPEAIFLLMPVWDTNGFGGVKLVNVHPGNNARNIPALSASYLLFDTKTGEHLGILDGGEITARRTAAASALAADYLAPKNASTQLLVGAGRVASNLAYAYRAVRSIEKVKVWDINPKFAERLVEQLNNDGFEASLATNLEHAVPTVDIISCATLARDPLVQGEWLQEGQHLDLIGGFTPDMREADDKAIVKSNVFIDTEAVFSESGDIIRPIENGILTKAQIRANLYDLCRGEHAGRISDNEITLFKAVGTALEDLAAASLAFSKVSGRENKV